MKTNYPTYRKPTTPTRFSQTNKTEPGVKCGAYTPQTSRKEKQIPATSQIPVTMILWLSWHMVCACWQLAYTNTTHPKLQLTTLGTTRHKVTEVEHNTKERADRRKGVCKNCDNIIKNNVCQLCWSATDLEVHFSHCAADWVLLILNGLTAKTIVYADFVWSQSHDIWFQNPSTGEKLFLKDVNLSGLK